MYTNEADLLNEPVFCDSTRVWRCYTGGRLLDEWLGNPSPDDTNFPEDWLASTTAADNGEWQQSPDEGKSVVRGTRIFFADLLKRHAEKALGKGGGTTPGVLCKFLDSACRLPIQCHPDREFSRKHYHSEHGKTESWFVLDTRRINGEEPYVLLGFMPGVTAGQFRRAVEAQDVPAMSACLHKFPARPGDVYFIPGRLPHAIGPGLLLLEVQEPTDFVIQPENRIGDVELGEQLMWGGLSHDDAFSCFNYDAEDADTLLNKLRLHPVVQESEGGILLENLIGPCHTDCFRVDKLTVAEDAEWTCATPWHLGVVVSGRGTIGARDEQPVKNGDRYFVSRQISSLHFRSKGTEPLVVYLVSRT